MQKTRGEILAAALISYIDGLVDSRLAELLAPRPGSVIPGEATLGAAIAPIKARKSQHEYPELFQSFMEAYPVERRKERAKAYKEWLKVDDITRAALPECARSYATEQLILKGHFRYMVWPERFIKNGTWESYQDQHCFNDLWILDAVNEFDAAHKRKTGKGHIWTDDLRCSAVEVIRAMGRDEISEKIWIFFSELDQQIKQLTDESGFGFGYFRQMAKFHLMISKIKMPTKCNQCGMLGGHDPDCPVMIEKVMKQQAEQDEIKEAQDMEFDLTGAFKKEIGRSE